MASISYHTIQDCVKAAHHNGAEIWWDSDWQYNFNQLQYDSSKPFYYVTVNRQKVDYTGAVMLKHAEVTPDFSVVTGSAGYRNISCYLYLSDPTTGNPGTLPPGYVATVSKSVYLTSTLQKVTFNFYNINTTSNYLYYLFRSDCEDATLIGFYGAPSGTFQYSPITMSLSSSSVTTGGNQVVTFTNGSGRSVSVSVKYNNTQLYSGSTSSGSLTIPVTKSWFSTAGVKTYREISVSIQATETDTGTISDSFYIVAGSDMNPTVGTPTVSIVQASGKPTNNFPNTYLANISKAKIIASVSSGSNADIASVVLTYTGGAAVTMTYNSSTGKYEATTPELTSASTTFTVTAKDGRKYNRSGTDVGGMSAATTTSAVSVVQYSPPSVSVDTGATFRCTQGGSQDSGGAYFRAKAASSYYSALSGNSLLAFYVKVQGKSTTYNLTSGVQTGALDGTLAATTNYTLEFVIEDKVSAAVTKTFQLGSQIRDLVAIHNSTGTAFGVGTTPQRAAGSSVELPIGGIFSVGGKEIQNFLGCNLSREVSGSEPWGKNLLAFEPTNPMAVENETAEFYITSGNFSGWTNLPAAITGQTTAFEGVRLVMFGYDSVFIVVLEQTPVPGRIWVNTKRKSSTSSAWSGWKGHTPDIT